MTELKKPEKADHTIGCATNATEVADEFASYGCTCEAKEINEIHDEWEGYLAQELEKRDREVERLKAENERLRAIINGNLRDTSSDGKG